MGAAAKAEMDLPRRRHVEVFAFRDGGVAGGGVDEHMHRLALADHLSAKLEILQRLAGRPCRRRAGADDLLHHLRRDCGVGAQLFPFAGRADELIDQQRELRPRGIHPAEDGDDHHIRQRGLPRVIVLPLCRVEPSGQAGDITLPILPRPRPRNQRGGEGGEAVVGGVDHRLMAEAFDPHSKAKVRGVLCDLRPARLVHSKQKADRPPGEGLRPFRHEIAGAALRRNLIEQVFGDSLEIGNERRDMLRRQRRNR